MFNKSLQVRYALNANTRKEDFTYILKHLYRHTYIYTKN